MADHTAAVTNRELDEQFTDFTQRATFLDATREDGLDTDCAEYVAETHTALASLITAADDAGLVPLGHGNTVTFEVAE